MAATAAAPFELQLLRQTIVRGPAGGVTQLGVADVLSLSTCSARSFAWEHSFEAGDARLNGTILEEALALVLADLPVLAGR